MIQQQKKLFTVNEKQKQDIFQAIMFFIQRIENPDVKSTFLQKINDDDFKNILIYSFAEITFMSQSLITSIKMTFDFSIIANNLLKSSENDIFEVQELKTYMLNQLSLDTTTRKQVDMTMTDLQFKEYKLKIAKYKRDYLNLFE